MQSLLATVQGLVAAGRFRVSAHGFEELASDDISLVGIVEGIRSAVVVEEYPDYHKGPCVLTLHLDAEGKAVHVLWGIARHAPDMATLITAYRPDPNRWSRDFMHRRPK